VLQAVDGEHLATPDVRTVDVRLGDRLLVCSDGLTDLVDDGQVAVCLTLHDPDDAATALVDAALAAGGIDNVTCVVADVVDGPWLVPDGLKLGAAGDPWLVVDPAAVHA
jgi:protein phosphatase